MKVIMPEVNNSVVKMVLTDVHKTCHAAYGTMLFFFLKKKSTFIVAFILLQYNFVY